jgi:hypothetical protein
MKPLWAISGRFAGWRSDNNLLYGANGDHVGYFRGNIAYSSHGEYVGEIYRDEWIGKNMMVVRPIGTVSTSYVGKAIAPRVDRVGLAIAGWEDPDF